MSTLFNIDEWHKLCEDGGQIAATIHPSGISMRPLIRGDVDTVIVMPLRRPLKRGDIVLFRRADGLDIMHRVWKIETTRSHGGAHEACVSSQGGAHEACVSSQGGAHEACVSSQGGAQITTFGDGCWYHDEPITQDKILGLAVTLNRAKNASSKSASATTKSASVTSAQYPYRKINLDTPARRVTGRIWLFFSPLRRCFYRLRNAAHWLKRQLKKRA